MNFVVVIFDIEASCEDRNINPHYNMETIEIGAVKVENGEITDKFQAFIKPEYVEKLTDFCTNLTGITYNDLKNENTFDKVILEFYSFMYGEKIYSCGDFDKKFLMRELKEKGSNVAHEMAYNAIKANHVNLKKLYSVVTNKKRKGMVGMANELNIELTGKHHRALDDSINLASIYIELNRMRDEIFWKELSNLDGIINHLKRNHNAEIYNEGRTIVCYGESLQIHEFIDRWRDVILKDYDVNKLSYINQKEFNLIQRMTL